MRTESYAHFLWISFPPCPRVSPSRQSVVLMYGIGFFVFLSGYDEELDVRDCSYGQRVICRHAAVERDDGE
jgi:hypothetical protein